MTLPLKLTSAKSVFYIIIVAQFCGTSVWFAGNAILPYLQSEYHWPAASLGYITSATQIGFIAGTFTFAFLGLADRLSPGKLFLICSFCASASNALCLLDLSAYDLVLISRVLTGFFLAGIYPVGMKIAADWNEKGLGHWLGALVGALVIGTALPHALKNLPGFFHSERLLVAVSALAIFGGLLIGFLVKDGPFRKAATAFTWKGVGKVFQIPSFRKPALGYFGHMWELYAFWAFVPWMVKTYESQHGVTLPRLLPFFVIACGAAGCLAGGWWSQTTGSFRVALYALLLSGLCCLLSPLMFEMAPAVFCFFLIFWGFMVVADSPQFSALVSVHAPAAIRGSSITIVTCIGFFITIVSISLLNILQDKIHPSVLLLLLLPGPLVGVVCLNLDSHD
jgi:MFS family permease